MQRRAKAKAPKGKRNPNQRPRNAVVTRAVAQRNTAARIIGDSRGVVISHRERFDTVTFVASENSVAFLINPGNSSLFPWLSTISPNYESYNFEALEFSYVTVAPVTTPGGITMAVDFDPADAPAATTFSLESYKGAVSFPAYKANEVLRCAVSDLNKRKSYYTRIVTGAVGDRLTDVGRFQYRTDPAAAGNVTVGRMYVSYRIRFQTPQLIDLSTPNLSVTVGIPHQSNTTYNGPELNAPAPLSNISIGTLLNTDDNSAPTALLQQGIKLVTGRAANEWTHAMTPERLLEFAVPGLYRIITSSNFASVGATTSVIESLASPNVMEVSSSTAGDDPAFDFVRLPQYTYSRTDDTCYTEDLFRVLKAGAQCAIRGANHIEEGAVQLSRLGIELTAAKVGLLDSLIPPALFPLFAVGMPGALGTISR